jgi:hypothetical protein
VAAAHSQDVLANLRIEANDQAIETFDSVRLNVQQWNAVTVRGGSAQVTFTGAFGHRSTTTSTWESEAANQWTAALTSTPQGMWQLLTMSGLPVAGGN